MVGLAVMFLDVFQQPLAALFRKFACFDSLSLEHFVVGR